MTVVRADLMEFVGFWSELTVSFDRRWTVERLYRSNLVLGNRQPEQLAYGLFSVVVPD